MARQCAICGKKRKIGHHVSYSKRRTKRSFKPNLHWARLSLEGKVRRVRVCAKCLKKAKKEGKIVPGRRVVKAVEVSQAPKVGAPKKRGRPKKTK